MEDKMEDGMEDSVRTRPPVQAAAASGPKVSAWEPLAVQDELFLRSEHAHAHMHVGATLLLRAERPVRHYAPVPFDGIRRRLEVRLDTLPRYRKRLAFTPLLQRPVWVDDDRFDIEHTSFSFYATFLSNSMKILKLSDFFTDCMYMMSVSPE